MAKKEALRELQNRLAERLQAAQSQPPSTAWLAVECAGQRLLFPLPQAGEIFESAQVLPVPHTQAWFAGVANLRGGLHGVVDLAAFLGLRPPRAEDGAPAGTPLVALNAGLGVNCALRVDRLLGLRRAGELAVEAPEDGPRPAFAGPRWRDGSGQLWQEIELSALAADHRFLAISG